MGMIFSYNLWVLYNGLSVVLYILIIGGTFFLWCKPSAGKGSFDLP